MREVDRDTEDTAGSTYEVELNRPNGASVEVDLDASVKGLATATTTAATTAATTTDPDVLAAQWR